MFDAQLRGKLSQDQENLEDILTSNVFGAFKYAPAKDGIYRLLGMAQDDCGKLPLRGICPKMAPTYEFWPFLEEPGRRPCEPDVLLKITDQYGRKFYVLVEAKYKSPKSSEADSGDLPYDQLAREWDNLVSLAVKDKAIPYLLYITSHFGYPGEDVEAARTEYKSKRDGLLDILWLSWREIPRYFNSSPYEIVRDMAKILRRLGLIFFEGFRIEPAKGLVWRFGHENSEPSTPRFNWSHKSPERIWRFSARPGS